MLPSGYCLRRRVVLWGHRMLARGFRAAEEGTDRGAPAAELEAGERPFRGWAVPDLNILKGSCGFRRSDFWDVFFQACRGCEFVPSVSGGARFEALPLDCLRSLPWDLLELCHWATRWGQPYAKHWL